VANILILGYDGLAGTELAAHLLAASEHRVLMLTDEMGFFRQEELFSLGRESFHKKCSRDDASQVLVELTSRFALVSCAQFDSCGAIEDLPQADEVWFLEGNDSADILNPDKADDRLKNTLSMLPRIKTHVFNYVYSRYTRYESATGLSNRAMIREKIDRQCGRNGIAYRLFETAALVADNHIRAGSGGNDIRQLLAALDDVSAEVQERLPEYFDFQSLRVLARRDASMNLIRVKEAVEIMVRLAQQEDTLGGHYCVASRQSTPLKNLTRLLGKVYGVGLTVVTDRQRLNAIDRLLEQRFSAVDDSFACPEPVADQDGLRMAVPESVLDEQALQKIFGAIRKTQQSNRTARKQHAASVYANLSPRFIERPGGRLNYFVAGSQGPRVLILNALGQGLEFWSRMTDQLMLDYRIVLWETRGIESESEPLQMRDHLEDIESVMEQEGINACHVIGWCTGPQLAAELFLRRPESILGMVFLNSVFKFVNRPELETPYSINLEKLCRLLDLHPEMAPSVMRSLSTPPANDINLMDETDTNNAAQQVLSLTNVDLRTHVLAPFRTVTTTLSYARQILSLLSCPTLEKASRVEAPILIVGCEYDQVASAAKSREAAGLFPRCRHIELPGATHYSLYDRTELVAAMLRRFFHDPSSVIETKQHMAVGG